MAGVRAFFSFVTAIADNQASGLRKITCLMICHFLQETVTPMRVVPQPHRACVGARSARTRLHKVQANQRVMTSSTACIAQLVVGVHPTRQSYTPLKTLSKLQLNSLSFMDQQQIQQSCILLRAVVRSLARQKRLPIHRQICWPSALYLLLLLLLLCGCCCCCHLQGLLVSPHHVHKHLVPADIYIHRHTFTHTAHE